MQRAITDGLRLRDVEVLTAQEDDARRLSDPELLDRAAALDRVLFSRDADLLREATRRQRSAASFGGVIYAHLLKVTVGQCIRDLELMAQVSDPEELMDRVVHLPLR